MKRIKEIFSSKRGMALLLVLALFALLMSLGVSMVFAANSSAVGSAVKFRREQARLTAQSVCEVIRGELTSNSPTPSQLKTSANALSIGGRFSLDIELPAGMGEIVINDAAGNPKSYFERTRDNQATLYVTSNFEGSVCTLSVLFSRAETGAPPNPVAVSWAFSGYQQLLPPPPTPPSGP